MLSNQSGKLQVLIVHITGPERLLAARQRASGFRHALQDASLPATRSVTLHGSWSEAWEARRWPNCSVPGDDLTRSFAGVTRLAEAARMPCPIHAARRELWACGLQTAERS
jgi:DNA-binding LacI/PurR family transcriptional regulator